MARVIIPDVSPFVASVGRPALDPDAGRQRDPSPAEKFAQVLALADRVARSPLVVGGIDAIRRSERAADDRALVGQIDDASAVGGADRADLLRRAAAARAARAAGPAPGAPPAPGGPMAERAYLDAQGLDPLQRAAVARLAEEARRSGRQVTPGVLSTLSDAAKEGQLLASPAAPEAEGSRGGVRAAKVAALAAALAAADTLEEVEAINRQFEALRAAPPPAAPAAPAAPADPAPAAPPPAAPADPAAPPPAAPAPERVEGVEVFTPGAGQSMAANAEERELERQLVAVPAAPAAPAAPAPAPAAPAVDPDPPLGSRLPDLLAPFSLPEAPPAPEDAQVEALGEFADALRLTSPEEVLAAARTAKTPEEQRVVSLAAANLAQQAPATNIFEALGLAPVKSNLVREVQAAFPRSAEADPRVRLQQLKIALEAQRAHARNERDKALFDAQIRNLDRQLDLIKARNAAKAKTPEERQAEAKATEAKAQAEADRAKAALISARASASRARTYRKYVEDLGPAKAKAKLTADIQRQQAAQNAEQRVLEKEMRQNQPLPEIGPFAEPEPKKGFGKAAEAKAKAWASAKAEHERRAAERRADNAKRAAARSAAERRRAKLERERAQTARDLRAVQGLGVPEAAPPPPPAPEAGNVFENE